MENKKHTKKFHIDVNLAIGGIEGKMVILDFL